MTSEARRYVLVYENGENFPGGAREHFPAHRERWAGYMGRGLLLSIGPFTDGTGALGVFATREAAEEFAAGDPFVLNKVVGAWHVHEWRMVSPE